MIVSKLTSKAQTTIPQPVRQALQLQHGDDIVYVIEGGRVTIAKAASSATLEDPFATFDEWNSDADRKAVSPIFEQGCISPRSFPYTDRSVRQDRPALVISDGSVGDANRFLWVVMITSAAASRLARRSRYRL